MVAGNTHWGVCVVDHYSFCIHSDSTVVPEEFYNVKVMFPIRGEIMMQ